jgi:hypothetical protein
MNILIRELMSGFGRPRLLAGVAAPMLIAAAIGSGPAAGVATAEVGFMPDYHWCPGDMWRPEWGFNWDDRNCHDDHHRDMDGPSHDHDWWP